MFDGKAFGQEIVTAVKQHMDRALGPILARLDEFERRFDELPTPKDGEDGKDADPSIVASIVTEELRKDIDGLRTAIEALPAPIEIPPAPELPDIPALVAEAVAAIPAPQNGKDADPDLVAALVRQEAERILAGWERPQNGKDGPSEETVKDMVATVVATLPRAADGAPGKDGRDGLDAVEFLRGAGGHLIVTMSNGTTRDLGAIDGKDGAAGADGNDGAPGKDGADGVGFDDLDMVETDDGVFLRCVRGDVVKQWRLPIVIDRGVFKDGQPYRKGDGVTWGGSFWIAQGETTDKPDSGKGNWRLAVKKGRDGKDGTVKEPRPVAPVKVG